MVQEIIQEVNLLASHQKIQFRLNNSLDPASQIIYCDRKRLEQIIFSFLENATRANDKGSFQFKISRFENILKFELIEDNKQLSKENYSSLNDLPDDATNTKCVGYFLSKLILNELGPRHQPCLEAMMESLISSAHNQKIFTSFEIYFLQQEQQSQVIVPSSEQQLAMSFHFGQDNNYNIESSPYNQALQQSYSLAPNDVNQSEIENSEHQQQQQILQEIENPMQVTWDQLNFQNLVDGKEQAIGSSVWRKFSVSKKSSLIITNEECINNYNELCYEQKFL